MTQATKHMRNIAKRLMANDGPRHSPAETKIPAPFDVCDQLRPTLATLTGNGGYRTLLGRALALAGKEVPWLLTIQVKPDGTLEGLAEHHARLGTDEFFEGGVVLLAQLLGLLVAFIGANLTARLVREVWPKVSVNDLCFDQGGNHEKTK
jgi:hypothetical protein